MAITLFGTASNPADNGSANEPVTLAVTPPGSMTTGDLVVMYAFVRNSGTNPAISATGGQSWTAIAEGGGNSQFLSVFWCTYNGTWSADPSVIFGGISATQPTTVVMHVYRQSTADRAWGVDLAVSSANFAAPSSPFTVTVPSRDTTATDTVAIAIWGVPDVLTFGSISGTGWAVAGGAQYRNTAGGDQSESYAYRVLTAAGATGDVSQNMSAGVAGRRFSLAFSSFSSLTSVKTYNGLAAGSTKTINELAIASRKTWDGLA